MRASIRSLYHEDWDVNSPNNGGSNIPRSCLLDLVETLYG